jgi:hypothetical protein
MTLRRRGDIDLTPSERIEDLAAQLLSLADEVSILAKKLKFDEDERDDQDEQSPPRD